MSEYQYYEFTAIDRPLTTREQADLRTLSTRANISATSFVNTYEWATSKATHTNSWRDTSTLIYT